MIRYDCPDLCDFCDASNYPEPAPLGDFVRFGDIWPALEALMALQNGLVWLCRTPTHETCRHCGYQRDLIDCWCYRCGAFQ